MFDPIARSYTLGRIFPIAVIGVLLLVAVGVPTSFGLLPDETWLVIVGPGLLLGALAAPEGIHSDSVALFFGLTIAGTIAWWYLIGKLVLGWLRIRREKRSRPR
jgi:hypothetical protein